MHRRLRRPSPSMVVALLALFVALGGSAVAAKHYISGTKIKPHSLTGRRVKPNSLTGRQIAESKLGTVKRAKSATNATNATNATTATNALDAGHAGSADNAARTGGFAPSDLVRSAYASSNTAVPLGGFGTGKTLLAATITVPRNGYLLVTTSAQFAQGSGNAGALLLDGLDVDDPGSGSFFGDATRSAEVSMGSSQFATASPGARFAVTAGTHTVRLKGQNDADGPLSFEGGSLTVTFEPFGTSGAEGTGTARTDR